MLRLSRQHVDHVAIAGRAPVTAAKISKGIGMFHLLRMKVCWGVSRFALLVVIARVLCARNARVRIERAVLGFESCCHTAIVLRRVERIGLC